MRLAMTALSITRGWLLGLALTALGAGEAAADEPPGLRRAVVPVAAAERTT